MTNGSVCHIETFIMRSTSFMMLASRLKPICSLMSCDLGTAVTFSLVLLLLVLLSIINLFRSKVMVWNVALPYIET